MALIPGDAIPILMILPAAKSAPAPVTMIEVVTSTARAKSMICASAKAAPKATTEVTTPAMGLSARLHQPRCQHQPSRQPGQRTHAQSTADQPARATRIDPYAHRE
ncbi:MAG TPA: hypothetical protein VMU92_10430 [Acidobacteriaceae bacterium]|nr:hypothetical protein [Acidobacteriaceae bacterium]